MIITRLGTYEYRHPYQEYYHEPVAYYRYPEDFYRMPDEPEPFIMVRIRTGDYKYFKKIYISNLKYIGE
jgi:hypothetical protein